MARTLDAVMFTPTAGGTTDWSVSAAVQGYMTPAQAGAVNGGVYKYRAESADLSQWEEGEGTYTTGSPNVLSRTTVLFNSAGTTAKINFTAAPNVMVVISKVDHLAIDEANSWSAAQQQQARSNLGFGAYKSRIRNGMFDIWQRGTAITPASAGSFIYTADGWAVDFVGAVGAVNRVANSRSGPNSLYAMQIVGATGCTDVQLKQRIESFLAAVFAGDNVTIQAQITNNTGGSITPQLAVNRCTAADNWGATANELAFTNLQACPNGATTLVSYTFALSTSAPNGIEVIFDFGNNFSAGTKSITIAEVDLQVTPNATVGLQSTPPLLDIRNVSEEQRLCQRYYFRRQSQSTNDVLNIMAAFSTTQAWGMAFALPVPMRDGAAPSIGMSSIGHINLNGTACSAGTFDSSNIYEVSTFNGLTVGSAVLTNNAACILRFNTASGWIDASREL